MTDLNQALHDIRRIRQQVAQGTEFRGYGPLTLSATAALALAAGVCQTIWVADVPANPARYVAVWLTTGLLCAALIATQMVRRANRLHSGMADEMIRMAVGQFLPAAAAGVMLPLVLLYRAPQEIGMLPGLWQVIFALGVFSSCRGLPKPMLAVGAWFLMTGMVCLGLGSSRALSAAAMAVPFAVGMAAVAAIHYRAAKKEFYEHESL